ncbi:MAG: hypothetical protein DRH23_07895 [Deltaproteobacteria bacterium]|nr:MAG: hypothetical protein DRH23_07895 [Deltaproteobacteria bacterium]
MHAPPTDIPPVPPVPPPVPEVPPVPPVPSCGTQSPSLLTIWPGGHPLTGGPLSQLATAAPASARTQIRLVSFMVGSFLLAIPG